jgi:hypothetical protein
VLNKSLSTEFLITWILSNNRNLNSLSNSFFVNSETAETLEASLSEQ